MSKKVILPALALFLLVVGVLYWQLGGTAKASISLSENASMVMVGERYKGRLSDRKLKELMQTMENRYRNGDLPGTFAICYFDNPDATESLEVMVGSLTDTLATVPEDLESQRFDFPQAIRASVEAHVIVAPSPKEVNDKIREFARVSKLKPTGIYIENYQTESHIVTIVPVVPMSTP